MLKRFDAIDENNLLQVGWWLCPPLSQRMAIPLDDQIELSPQRGLGRLREPLRRVIQQSLDHGSVLGRPGVRPLGDLWPRLLRGAFAGARVVSLQFFPVLFWFVVRGQNTSAPRSTEDPANSVRQPRAFAHDPWQAVENDRGKRANRAT